MLKNYFRVALRNLLRSKGFSFINVAGLAVGMASAMLIFLWMNHELTFDDFHENKDRLYQAWNRGLFDDKLQCWQSTPKALGPALKEEHPEVEAYARGYGQWFVTSVGDKKMSSLGFVTDAPFLTMFTYPLIQGDVKTALADGYSIVVTEKFARKMFDAADVMGREVKINDESFKISGILKDLPTNSDFTFEYLLPWGFVSRHNGDDPSWDNNSVRTYVLLREGTTAEMIKDKIKGISNRHSEGIVKEEIFLHPLSLWHLHSRFENGEVSGGRIQSVRLFGIVGAFILLIACINFMNLSTARSEKRAKEVGIRKVAGAVRALLIAQFLIESILLATIAGAFAIMIVQVALPYFNLLINTQLVLRLTEPTFWLALGSFILFTGVLAGSYPAFFLSSFKPVVVLKGTFKRTFSNFNPRRVLVITQFTFAITLIICTFIVTQQIRYAQDRDRGYDGNRLVYHWITGDLEKNYQALKAELINEGIATNVTKTMSPLSMIFSDTWDLQWQGKVPGDKTDFERLAQDEGLVKTAGLQLVAGRDLDLQKYPADSTGMLLNESAVKAMGFKNPIGEIITETNDIKYHVVGVVKDFILSSPYDRTKPLVIGGIAGNGFNVINIKMSDNITTSDGVKSIQRLFEKYNPQYPFEYHFVDDDYARKFDDSQRIAKLSSLFTGLAIFISCLGLFGLASFMAEVRVKEIGIRKVLGASVARITALLTKDFLVLVLIAVFIAVPISWYAMSTWLKGFSYRVPLQWWVFILSGAFSIAIALLTVSYQSIRAALENPVKSLRNE